MKLLEVDHQKSVGGGVLKQTNGGNVWRESSEGGA